MKTRIRFLCCSKDVLIHRGPNTYVKDNALSSTELWRNQCLKSQSELICLQAPLVYGGIWLEPSELLWASFQTKKSTCSYKRIKAREALFLFVCLFLCLHESLVANERRARGAGKRQTRNATLSWCRLRCLELARVHTNWLTLSHKLLLKVKSIKRRLIDFQSLRFLLNAAGIRSLIQDKDNPKKKTKSKT